MSRCLTVHRHMQVTHGHDAENDERHEPAAQKHDETLKLFKTESTETLPCVHQLIKAHYTSMRSLRRVLKPPPPSLPVQVETLDRHHLELLTGPIRDVCDTLTTHNFSMVVPTTANVHMMGTDVFYVSLYHGETMMMGIFFMPPNSVIPLHDHPFMSVVSRVLYGSVHLNSYTILDADATDDDGNAVVLAEKSRDKNLQAPCTMELSPSHHNVHELVAGSEIGCAIFDVMIPPYDDDHRHGNDYKIVGTREADVHVLQRIVKD